VLLAFLLYRGILRESWANDDLVILQHIAAHSWVEILTSGTAWREFAPLYFFPAQLWSLKLDLSLWGPDPFPFRIRQLLELGIAAYVLFRLLQRRVGIPLAAWAGLLLLCSVPAAVLAQQLMCRHYADGVLLSLLAYAALERSIASRRRPGLLVLAALLYFLAILCKEIFVALPVIALLCSPPLRRLRGVYVAAGTALLAALAYRLAMLGSVPRVYRADIWTASALLQNARLFASSAGSALFYGDGRLQAVAATLLLVPVLLAGVAKPRFLTTAAACAATQLIPALLVADVLGSRHLLGLWVLLLAGAATSVERLPAGLRRGGALVAGAALACVLLGNRLRWELCLEESRLYTEIDRFLLQSGRQGDYLQLPDGFSSAGYAFGPAGWLRRHLGDGARGPAILAVRGAGPCVLDLPLSGNYHQLIDGHVVPDRAYLARRSRACGPARRTVPLVGEASYQDSLFHWELGPYGGGGLYSILVLGSDPDREIFVQMYGLPRAGTMWLLNGPKRLVLMFLYESDEGWYTATEPRTFERVEGMRVRWLAVAGAGPAHP